MTEKEKLQELQQLASNMPLLYVEDNEGMREKATQLLQKFFKNVYIAQNGEEGLALFRSHRPKIVITDIQMPKMDGLEMAKQILKIAPQTKIMITSTFDDSDYLIDAINIGIFRYLKKPVTITELSTVLLDGLKQLNAEENEQLFHFYVQNIFNNEKSLLILYQDKIPRIVNNAFLDYFGVDNLEEFTQKFNSLGEHFLEHKDFLYNKEDQNWFSQTLNNIDKLYNVKMHDKDQNTRHFILKVIPIHGKDDYFLVSMDDITELSLLQLFEEERTQNNTPEQDESTLIKFLDSVKRNKAELKVQNMYKGVTIINKATFTEVSEEKIELKCSYMQQKAATKEGHLILSSELFPSDIIFQSIEHIDFDQQTIQVAKPKLITSSPRQRKSIRLEPEQEHTATLTYHDHHLKEDVHIIDISIDAVNLSILFLPAGFKVGTKVHLELVFDALKNPLLINTPGEVFTVYEQIDTFNVIIKLELSSGMKKLLIDYLAKRQMELIREFKHLQ